MKHVINKSNSITGGKTYCIPKATMTQATQQQQQITQPQTISQPVAQTTTTPALPVNPVPQQQLPQQQPAPTIGTVQTQSPTGQKHMVEVKSLGQNTVTLKGKFLFYLFMFFFETARVDGDLFRT